MTILRFLPAAFAAAALFGAAPHVCAEMIAPTLPDSAPIPPKVQGAGNDELVIPADQTLRDALSGAKQAPTPAPAPAANALPPAPGSNAAPPAATENAPHYDGDAAPEATNPAPAFGGSLQTPASLDEPRCGNGGCESGYECCIGQPRWTAFGDVVFLHRSAPNGVSLVETAGTTVFTANDIDFQYEPAWRTGILRRGECVDLELAYFGTAPWNESASYSDPLSSVTAFDAFGITRFDTQFNFAYDHDLYMAEANLWRPSCSRLSWMGGFRYANLKEDFIVSGGGFDRLIDSATDNRLYGGQLGAKATLWCDATGFQVDVLAKAGAFVNHAKYRLASDVVVPVLSDSTDRFAFLGDLSVVARYPVTNHLWLRGGFQLLFVDGVALATDQSGSPNFASNAAIDANDSVFYHGGFVGLEMNW